MTQPRVELDKYCSTLKQIKTSILLDEREEILGVHCRGNKIKRNSIKPCVDGYLFYDLTEDNVYMWTVDGNDIYEILENQKKGLGNWALLVEERTCNR
jgi:cobalamin biosynthesis Co2+ chelatase CbiK